MDTGIQKYQAFVTTVETGSFSVAARTLSYSQSGVSRMIADLENDWGVQLLERSKAGVRLTSDGLKLLPHARALIREYESLRHAIDGLAGLTGGLLRIGAHRGMPAKVLSDVIARFAKECPGIDYELRTGTYTEIEELLRTGRLDLAFSRFPAPSGLDGSFYAQEELVAVRRGQAGDECPIAELAGEAFILFSGEGMDDVPALLRRCGVSPDVRAVSDDPGAVIAMAAGGLGSAILPEGLTRSLPRGLSAARLDVPAYITTGVILRSRRSASVAAGRFLELLER